MYHPHFHVILMVNKSYLTDSTSYISQERWTSLWKESLQCDYTPIVHIQPFRSAGGKEVAEVSKYTVKDNDYLVKSNLGLTDRTSHVRYGVGSSTVGCFWWPVKR